MKNTEVSFPYMNTSVAQTVAAETGLIEPKKGIVGFFDILGFNSYLENDPDVRSKEVLAILLGIKASIPERVKRRIPRALIGEIRWSAFADSILLTIPYPEDGDHLAAKRDSRATFLLSGIVLLDQMFDHGLPLRGGIAFGNYFCQEALFAGGAIFAAHKEEGSINLSGVVLHKSAEDELCKLGTFDQGNVVSASTTLLRYCVPLKKNVSEQRIVLNQWALRDHHDNDDVAQLVDKAFCRHGKKVDSQAAMKLHNTKELLRFVIATKKRLRHTSQPTGTGNE